MYVSGVRVVCVNAGGCTVIIDDPMGFVVAMDTMLLHNHGAVIQKKKKQ